MIIEQPTRFLRWLYPHALWRMDHQQKAIYLTFDDGPIPEATPFILDVLDQEQVKATFFMVGDNANKYPQLLDEVRRRGHRIGNHTYNHIGGLWPSAWKYLGNVRQAEDILQTDKLFRPPHGWLDHVKYRVLRYTGWRVVMWDVVTRDYSNRLTAQDVLRNVKRYTRNGSIITFHDSLKSIDKLHEILPEALQWLKSQGYEFRTLQAAGISEKLKAEALRLGFQSCGLAPAELVDTSYMDYYRQWLFQGNHGEMHYLEHHIELRRDPRLMLDGTQTIVSLAMSYHPGTGETQEALAWYAQGKDYHDVVREKVRQLAVALNLTDYRICVDTAPIMERYWAWRCGLGWIGRHTQLVIPHIGSAFFLAELLLTLKADRYDQPLTDSPFTQLCGLCRRCLQACPTEAISSKGLDARRCLSYLTIEHQGELPPWTTPHLKKCFYGCDRCLRACPHLSDDKPTPLSEFRPSAELLAMTPEDWHALTPEQYRQLFRGSAVKRAKYEGLMRNIKIRG